MKKIKVLFKRFTLNGVRIMLDILSEGSDWVWEPGAVASIKYEGMPFMVSNGKGFVRYDIDLSQTEWRLKIPLGWTPSSEAMMDIGCWPGWIPYEAQTRVSLRDLPDRDGTYEVVGPNIKGNPYSLDKAVCIPHGAEIVSIEPSWEAIKSWMEDNPNHEGLVWHSPNGDMVKIRRKDFGLEWGACDTVQERKFVLYSELSNLGISVPKTIPFYS